MAKANDPHSSDEVAELRQRLANVEAELRSTQRQLADLDQHYAMAPVGLCLVDTELRYVRVNQRLAEINGVSIEGHLGNHLRDVVPQIIDTIEPIYRRVIETGEPVDGLEVAGVAPFRPDIESTFLASYFPLNNADGSMLGIGTVIQDVTALKEAEHAQKESEARVRTMLDNAPEAIVVFDADTGKFVDWNDNTLKLFCADAETIATSGPIEFSPVTQPDGRRSGEAAPKLIAEALSGKIPSFDWVHCDSQGEEVPCEIRLARLPMSGRNLVRASITDISARRRAEQELQLAHSELEERVAQRTAELSRSTTDLERSEERWRSLIATAPDLILTILPDGTIEYINRVEQGDLDDVLGSSAYSYIVPEHQQKMIDGVARVVEKGEFVTLELASPDEDGQIQWYQSRLGPYRENGKTVAVTSIATNITRRKVAEARLHKEQILLRRLLFIQENERRMVAHDIHDGFVQYVIGAQMHLQAMSDPDEDTNDPLISDVDSYLQKAISEGRRMIRDLRPMVLDEAGIVESLTHLIAEEEKNDRMIIAFEHDVQFNRLEPMLEGAIFRIVQESLNNVRQHSQTRHAGVQLIQNDDILRIAIRDQGVGFDMAEVSPDRFGLEGIQERARLFGGSAEIETVLGKGTSVIVRLPITVDDLTPLSDQ